MQPPSGQLWKRRHALAQVAAEWVEQRAPGLARVVDRRLQAALDVLAHGFAVEPGASGNGRHRQALAVQVKDHDDLP
jgi:hypothetical protein